MCGWWNIPFELRRLIIGSEGMAEVINLNHFRKVKLKADKDTQAAYNRARHGRRKGDRARQEDEKQRRRQDLEGRGLDERDPDNSDEPA
ncbi:MAG: hypothetical protein CMM23_05915 [Rhodospirillaceae bacterium]|nr:hypothetical protein [Rhodospirillaceae bacterium]